MEMGRVQACILLAKLSLVHMRDLGMISPNAPIFIRIFKETPVSGVRDFAPFVAKLVAEIRDEAAG